LRNLCNPLRNLRNGLHKLRKIPAKSGNIEPTQSSTPAAEPFSPASAYRSYGP